MSLNPKGGKSTQVLTPARTPYQRQQNTQSISSSGSQPQRNQSQGLTSQGKSSEIMGTPSRNQTIGPTAQGSQARKSQAMGPANPGHQPQVNQPQGNQPQGNQPQGNQPKEPSSQGPQPQGQGGQGHVPGEPTRILINQNSEKLLAAFMPVWWFLLVMGQMPFRIVKKGSKEAPIYNFRFSTVSLQTIIYGITFMVFTVLYLLVTCGIFYFFFSGYTKLAKDDFPDPQTRMLVTVSLEKYETREQLIPMLVTWALMSITFMGFITVFVKGSNFVQYFDYWNSVVQIIDIDPTVGIRKYFIFQNLISAAISVIFVGGFFIPFDGSAQGSPIFKLARQLGNMFLGMIKRYDEGKDDSMLLVFVFMLIVMTYGIIGSRVQIMPFIFYSQLLKNASQIWNERFRNLIKDVDLKITKQSHRRVDYGNLLKDHLVLVQLFKMTENTFSIALIAFYFVNFFCIILELYFLASLLLRPLTDPTEFAVIKWDSAKNAYVPANQSENKVPAEKNYQVEVEKGDNAHVATFVIITVLMSYQIFTTYQVTYQATQAYQHAMAGFSILRKHGFMHCKNKTERNFIHTLVFSFARNNPMMITGGGYFPLNNTLIIAMVANLINFVVFMYQFKPDDWDDLEYNWNEDTSG